MNLREDQLLIVGLGENEPAERQAAVCSAIERICREAGYEPPIICTPEELTEQ